MARRRSRCRETVSLLPCEVRDRRRASVVDRLGELRKCGLPCRSGRQPRLVGDRGRSESGGHSPKRLRSGLRSATTRFDSGTRSGDAAVALASAPRPVVLSDRKSTRLNSSHSSISYAVFCLKKKKDNECTFAGLRKQNYCECTYI